MSQYPDELARVAFSYPAIDNHAHPLLKEQHKDYFPFEGLVSEASGSALIQDAPHTMAAFRATIQLGALFGIPNPTWEAVKTGRQRANYNALCDISMKRSNIQCILIDDGLGGVKEFAEDYQWHDRFTRSPTKRIVRVEIVAEDILKDVMNDMLVENSLDPAIILRNWGERLDQELRRCGSDPTVAGFKSIACYRTGLDILQVSVESHGVELKRLLTITLLRYEATKTFRLAEKLINDFVVNLTLRIAQDCGKPVQFHTGLGDNDISLSHATPALMQPIIKAFPNTKFILLHSSYPFTREAGYLAAVYPNVYLDFGEIFPFLSADGQVSVVKQVIELCPTNKILWSTDGHWWPESYYLGSHQARQALYEVLSTCVKRREMTEAQAIEVIKAALFENSNRVYGLNLKPIFS
ncbi:amidohydrolase-domain-containing protein [Abortiporus biennis]|nr:amidohydrolase-domain-containing protein [Abortiporus biennis]